MTDSVNTRELILGILMEVTKEGSYSHLVIRSVLDKYQYLEKKERAFITRVSEGTIQYMIELDYIINQFSKVKVNKMKPVICNILRMSVYQLKYMDSVPDSAVCNEAVKLAKRKGFGSLSGFVNGVLRNISRNLSTITYPDGQKDQIQYLSVRYSMPEWIVRQWINDYGMEQTVSVLQAFLQETPVTIRTNLLKITPEALEKRLKEEGVTAEKMVCADMPELNYAFMISGFDHLNALASFREGLFYVQDVSSMMVAETVAPKKDSYIIDVCAAPGGKSVHLAEKLGGTGMVEARDLTEYKTDLIRQNIARHQLSNMRAVQMDATVLDEASIGKADVVIADLPCSGLGVMRRKTDLTEYKTDLIRQNIARHQLSNMRAVQMDATVLDEASIGKADVVIADLPCSGLGVMRRKTDIKYKMTLQTEQEIVSLQRNMLETVCQYVKVGGTLLYSTCTMDKMENEDNVTWFLKQHPQFELVKMQQIFPQKTYGDGFFLAKLQKKA